MGWPGAAAGGAKPSGQRYKKAVIERRDRRASWRRWPGRERDAVDVLDEGGGESGIGLDRPPCDRASGSLSGVDDAFGFRSRPHAARGGVATSSVQPGDVIGGVVIERHVGEGGMGSVHAGRELGTGRRVAVKLVRMTDASPAAHDRFAREARLLARLRHPNVAQLYAFGTHDGATGSMPYLVLEFVEDARPITRFARETGLDVRGRVRLLRDACRGLAHAHERGVVHRDIKPGNLLVDAAGTSRVIDFGVARASEAEGADGTGSFATAVGDLVGTLQYMSPEQIDATTIDHRSDLYCLGLILYELLEGRPPFVSQSPRQLLNLQCTAEPPELSAEVRRGLPQGVETLLFRLLEKAPEDRPYLAHDVVSELEPFIPAAGSSLATKPSSGPRPRERSRATLAAGGAVTPRSLREAPLTAVEPPPSPAPSIDAGPSRRRAEAASAARPSATDPASSDDARRAPPPTRNDTIQLLDRKDPPRELPRAVAIAVIVVLSVLSGALAYWLRARAARGPEDGRTPATEASARRGR